MGTEFPTELGEESLPRGWGKLAESSGGAQLAERLGGGLGLALGLGEGRLGEVRLGGAYLRRSAGG